MLFDLRSRGRRHAVRVIYLFLALVMVAGLVLVGVGTGSGGGGLLNAFTSNGSGGGQNSAVNQATKTAVKAVKKHPNSAAAWSSLVQARWTAAATGTNIVTTSTGATSFTAGGKKQLKLAAQSWQKYLTLTGDKPSLNDSVLAARVYQSLEQWADASTAWEYAAGTQKSGSTLALKPYTCMALAAYSAGQTSKGELAAAAAVKLTPKLQQLETKQTFSSAKSSKTTAQQTLVEDC